MNKKRVSFFLVLSVLLDFESFFIIFPLNLVKHNIVNIAVA